MTYQVLLPLALSLSTQMTRRTVNCIWDTVDKALSELNSLRLENTLTPLLAKYDAMLLMRKPHIGPLNFVTIGDNRNV